MRVTSDILVQDPVDAYELWAAAAQRAEVPAPSRGWHLPDFGAVNILEMDDDPDAMVALSIRFTAAGDGLPAVEEEQLPKGYALVCLATTGGDPPADRLYHRRLVNALGLWLSDRSLQWCWRYDDEPWKTSPPAQP